MRLRISAGERGSGVGRRMRVQLQSGMMVKINEIISEQPDAI
jgi:hypothetical protein